MTENSNLNGDFTVASGEAITVTISAFGTPNRCVASLDGQPLTPRSSGNPYIFRFTLAGALGNVHLFAAECFFGDDAAADAKYTAVIAGSDGSSYTLDPAATPDSSEFLLRFTIG